MQRTLVLLTGFLMVVVSVGAQVEPAPVQKFEVASVKANTSGRLLPSLPTLSPGRLALSNIGLRQLVNLSHEIQPFQLEGLPSWAESARFDIIATSRGDASVTDLLGMVRALLADRFQLVTRRDTRQMDVYSLVQVAPGASKLKPSEADCDAAANQPLAQTADGPRCQILPMTGRGRVIATGARSSHLTNILTNVVGRQVVDKTGLTGPFNVNLTWTPDPGMQPRTPGVPAVAPVQPDGPSIFTALEEQLGLRLVPGRGPVEMLVIQRLEPPGPD